MTGKSFIQSPFRPAPAGRRARAGREGAGGLAVGVGLLAGHERVAVAVDVLQQALAAGGEVELEARRVQAQGLEVDDVDVGPVAGREHAAVVAGRRCGPCPGTGRCTTNGEVELLAPGAVAAPVGEQGGGEAGVADRADVGAAVGEAGHRVRVGQHLAGGVEVAVGVVEDRACRAAPGRRRPAAGRRRGRPARAPARGGPGGDAVLRRRLVVGRVAEHEQAVEAARRAAGANSGHSARMRLAPARARAGAATRSASGRPAICLVRRAAAERVQRAPAGRAGCRCRAAATWARICSPSALACGRAAASTRRCVGAAVRPGGERDRQRPARWPAIGQQRLELVVDVGEVGHHLQHALARRRRAPSAMPTSSSRAAVSDGVSSPLLVRWFRVRRGGEAERAGLDALGGQPAHLGDLVGASAGGRGRRPRSPIT